MRRARQAARRGAERRGERGTQAAARTAAGELGHENERVGGGRGGDGGRRKVEHLIVRVLQRDPSQPAVAERAVEEDAGAHTYHRHDQHLRHDDPHVALWAEGVEVGSFGERVACGEGAGRAERAQASSSPAASRGIDMRVRLRGRPCAPSKMRLRGTAALPK
jgi:hypothetical protein